jgi:N-acetylneuraminic acid mutarotase
VGALLQLCLLAALLAGCSDVTIELLSASSTAGDAMLPSAQRADGGMPEPASDASSVEAGDGAPALDVVDASMSPSRPAWMQEVLPYASGAAASAVLSTGLHYLGGSDNYQGDTRYTDHYVYDAVEKAWSAAAADVPDNDTWGARAHVYQDRLYLLGGWPAGNRFRVYDPSTDAWTSLKAPPVSFEWGFASAVIGAALYAFGGDPGPATNAPGYRYDFDTNAWAPVAAIPLNEGEGALSAAVVDARLYVLNGNPNDGTTVLQIYDSITDSWSMGATLEGHIFEAAAALAVGSDVYFFGGANRHAISDHSATPAVVSSTVNIYDSLTDTWSTGLSMSVPKMWATAALYDGSIHVLGGLSADSLQLETHEVLALDTPKNRSLPAQ